MIKILLLDVGSPTLMSVYNNNEDEKPMMFLVHLFHILSGRHSTFNNKWPDANKILYFKNAPLLVSDLIIRLLIPCHSLLITPTIRGRLIPPLIIRPLMTPILYCEFSRL